MSELKRRKLADKNNSKNRRPQQRHAQKPAPKAPTPPAYLQRDLLLIATAATSQGIEEVRLKFDPLAKKIPAHVTLLFPEPSKSIAPELLKTLSIQELPGLKTLQFSQVIVHDEMYLWLLPSEESREKLLKWREAALSALTTNHPHHTQGEEFIPHITLGYVPRSLTPEEAVSFAQNLITPPLEVSFAKILLEEFSENQVSTSVDAIIL